MNREISAGGIIVCYKQGAIYVLLMKDMKGHWTFPKGKIEEGEDLRQTALREIEEEVGVKRLTFIAELTPVMYWYFRVLAIRKTVHYFLFRSDRLQNVTVQTEEGISEAKWTRWEEASAIIGYPKTNRPLLREAEEKLKATKK
jgi:8-oxo-dGTP pyrophosphatase MutT (NUDIX family)